MSSSIWTRCGAGSNLRPLLIKLWRAVDAEAALATRKLVDSAGEQETLERLIEASERAAYPPEEEPEDLHPLLATPFRHPPLAHGSRFGARHERGLWYGSERERTAFAEVAYYRLLFLDGTTADLRPILIELSIFRAPVHTERGIDLTRPPFDDWRDELASKTDYAATQALGGDMRRDGVEAFRFVSARDLEGGVNCALFTPRAFAARRPGGFRSWICVTERSGVEMALKDPLGSRVYYFPREDFEVDGALPLPAG